jgi:ASPIC and UnbV/FG-GAP-like repeat/Secretion system C-terminal sorting domain
MTKNITLFTATALIALGARGQNSCSTAQAVTAGTYTVDGINGPEIPVPICANTGVGATHTEWFTYTPAQDYSLTITTDLAQNANGDTRFHIYEGNCGSLSCLGGADDQGTVLLAAATVQVAAGLTYRIAFDDRWSNAGFDFRVTEGPPVVTEFNFTVQPIPGGLNSECVVDMDGDGLDDIVATNTTLISIAHQQASGVFQITNITTTPADHTASWSIAAGDIDNNGYMDLIYGSGQGATFMYAGPDGTSFNEVSFAEYIFCQRTNFVDINADGNLDAFSCHDVAPNVAFMNDGSGNLTFSQGGFGTTCGNYGSIWIDYDDDGDVDCFVAKCGCDPIDLLMRNNGDGTFTDVAASLGLADSHQSWSSAWGDFDNDGDMDVLIGSSSSNVHKLMRNNGGTFTNVTPGSGYDTFGGQSTQWATHDFNNDGYLDILGANALFLGHGDLTFTQAAVATPYNGAVGDLNNDGFLDVVSGNGMYVNSGNTNKYLRVNLIGVQSNRNGIGARVEVTSALGTQKREIRSGDAFSTMSSLMAHFGLGTDTEIEEVVVRWPSGVVDVVPNPTINSTIDIVEGTGNTGMAEARKSAIGVFPNPASDVLTVSVGSGVANGTARIIDITGKEVMRSILDHGRLDISAIPAGVYAVEVTDQGRTFSNKFNKL